MALCLVCSGMCPGYALAEPHSSKLPPPALLPTTQAWLITLPSPPSAGGAMDAERVYVPLSSMQVVAIDRESGTVSWTYDTSTVSPPLVSDTTLILVAPDALVALNAGTGAARWRTPLDHPAKAASVRGNRGVVALDTGVLLSFNVADGSIAWRVDLGDTTGPYSIGITDATVFVAMSGGRLVARAANDGGVRWEQTLPGTLSPPVGDHRYVFVGSTDNFFYALHADSGRLAWRMRAGGDVIGAALAGDAVYYASLDNVVRALNGGNGNQRWRRSTSTRPVLPPSATSGEIVIVGLAPTLSTFNAKTGMPIGTYAAPGELVGEPLIDSSLRAFRVGLVVITRDGRVIGLRPNSVIYREPAPVPLQALPGKPLAREKLP